MVDVATSPAEVAAEEAWGQIQDCLKTRQNFLLKAGAGAGKTHSLVAALNFLAEKSGAQMLRDHQLIACITYTNVATNEIKSRTDAHPVVFPATIHSFCWALIQDLQPFLRRSLPTLSGWAERIQESGLEGIGNRKVEYNLGYPKIEESKVLLGHNDVIALTSGLLSMPKFRRLLSSRFPVVFIDEYQDTDRGFAEALKTHVMGQEFCPLLGFFGDHWQKIYPSGCGKIEHPKLRVIGKQANFRSVPIIVEALNRLRPELPQHVRNPDDVGQVSVFSTNGFRGQRRTGNHWNDDLPAVAAHSALEAVLTHLNREGWDFSVGNGKILMLTHNVMAGEQGYRELLDVFPRKEAAVGKEDAHIAFFVDVVEFICTAFTEKRFGDVFQSFGPRAINILSHGDKEALSKFLTNLVHLRQTRTIGEVIAYLRAERKIVLPEEVEKRERELEAVVSGTSAANEHTARLQKLHAVSYQQVSALAKFINEKTPFSTKHGVKGAEFNDVLVILGRGWNHYNFSNFLELHAGAIPAKDVEFYERNRNLFYVACSRAKRRLALLFTQKLSDAALHELQVVFGKSSLQEVNF